MGKNTGSNRTFEWIYIGESTFTDEDGFVFTRDNSHYIVRVHAPYFAQPAEFRIIRP